MTLRYNHQNFTGEGFETGGPQIAYEHTGDSRVLTRSLNASWAAVYRNGFFNELRAQYARDHEPGTANSDDPEAIVQQGPIVLIIGRNTSARVRTGSTASRWPTHSPGPRGGTTRGGTS